MPAPIRTRCPHCRATLTLKNAGAVGKQVPCPKCRKPFVVKSDHAAKKSEPAAGDEFDPLADDFSDEDYGATAPPPVMVNRVSRRERRRRAAAAEREEAQQKSMAVLGCLSTIVWVNANIAVAVCVIDSAIDFLWLLTHFGEVYEQVGVGRIVVRQLGRPLLVIITALIVWYEGVLWRDISVRGAVIVFGAAYLLLFGVVAFIIGMLAQSIYERPVYAIQWSVIYLGVSLLIFAFLGYGPETRLQRAERLTSEGRYSDALTAVQQSLQEDPDDRDAVDLERTLRDMIRHG